MTKKLPRIHSKKKTQSVFSNLPQPFFVLAPMDDVTDVVFRQIIAELYKDESVRASHMDAAQGDSEARNETYNGYDEASTGAGNEAMRHKPAGMAGSARQQGKAMLGPDLYMTEFVNVDGLCSAGREKLMPRLKRATKEKNVIAQLWGKNPDNFRQIAAECVEIGFAGVDINFGCPDKTVVRNNACSAFILPGNRPMAVEIIKAVQEGVNGKVPVSVKTRLGFNEVDLSWHELLLKQDIDMLTIHGRTKAQMSKVPADWEQIAEIRKLRDKVSPKTLIVGNGDVMNRRQGLELAEEHKLDGIMIGRGIFNDPYCFAENSPWETLTRTERIALFRKHVELFASTWKQGERRFDTLKKFAKIYINDFNGASELRAKIMNTHSIEELLPFLKD